MESFVKIFDNMSSFKGQSSLETWMRRIVVNTSINKIRSRKFTESIDNETLHIGYSDHAFDAMDAKALMKMLEKLPVGYRMVFNLFAVEGYAHREIAELLNIDEGTSRSQLAKARKALQDMIEKKGVINI